MSRCAYKMGTGCSLGQFGGMPTDDDCATCSMYAGPDRGLGDKVHRAAVRVGADKIAGTFERLTGRDCGCGRRRAKLNRLSPNKD